MLHASFYNTGDFYNQPWTTESTDLGTSGRRIVWELPDARSKDVVRT